MTHAAAPIPSRARPRLSILLIVLVLVFTGVPQAVQAADPASAGVRLDKKRQPFPPPPPVPALRDAALSLEVQKALAEVVPSLRQGRFPSAAVKRIGSAGDGRLGWLLYDLLRFADRGSSTDVVAAFEKLTGAPLVLEPFTAMGDRLLAWNLPPPPGYRELKRDLFLMIEPRWAPFFDDPGSDIDWRQVGWGGVFIDDRPDATRGAPCPRGCIPALDQPKVTPASQGNWYPDNAIVFGIVVNGEARAYPKNMMEVHEMVNDTLGGRRIGIPYCTLCGAAQAYFTDRVSGVEPLLRTSGLLARSNKFMYDRRTWSAFDTFTGRAISGPLHKAGVTLQQATVVTATWGAWRQAHPRTSILAHDGGIGRTYELDPLDGRDEQGPIFPVGSVDPRLPVHEVVLGVTAPNGRPLAFPRAAAQIALGAGEKVRMAGVEVRRDAGGLRAFVDKGELTSHEAFWFAWSQFKPGTELWQRGTR